LDDVGGGTATQATSLRVVVGNVGVTQGPRPSVAAAALYSPLGHRPTDRLNGRLTSFTFGKETASGVSVEIDPALTATAAALTADRRRHTGRPAH